MLALQIKNTNPKYVSQLCTKDIETVQLYTKDMKTVGAYILAYMKLYIMFL